MAYQLQDSICIIGIDLFENKRIILRCLTMSCWRFLTFNSRVKKG